MLMFSLLHSYNPSPVLATVGPFTIYWYGLFYTISIALSYWLVASTLKRILSTDYSLPTTHSTALRLYGLLAPRSPAARGEVGRLTASLPEFSFGLVVSGLIGARLYHVLNEWQYYWTHPMQVFAVWTGGLAIHGALIAGLIFLWFYAKHQTTTHYPLHSTHYLFLLDLLSPAVLLGQAIGRWGNYFNQELFGYPTSLPWGIPISSENRPSEFAEFTYFHPTFLYESLWDFIGFIILFILQRRLIVYLPHEVLPSETKEENSRLKAYGLGLKAYHGLIFSAYLVWMSLGRIIVELIRIDQVPLILNVRLPTITSATVLLAGIVILLALTKYRKPEYT